MAPFHGKSTLGTESGANIQGRRLASWSAETNAHLWTMLWVVESVESRADLLLIFPVQGYWAEKSAQPFAIKPLLLRRNLVQSTVREYPGRD
jgi:hypothetical protein